MNAQIYSMGLILRQRHISFKFFQWEPENSFMAKGSSKYQRHWGMTVKVFTPFFTNKNIGRFVNAVPSHSLLNAGSMKLLKVCRP